MAERRSNSVIFTPPMDSVPKSDPQIVRVNLETTEWGARPSATNSVDWSQNPAKVVNIPNGR